MWGSAVLTFIGYKQNIYRDVNKVKAGVQNVWVISSYGSKIVQIFQTYQIDCQVQ